MKLRQGFVSNSSSSSFIVAFPAGIAPTPEAVHAYLYGATPGEVRLPWSAWSNDAPGVSTMDAATLISRDMSTQHPNDWEAIEDALNGEIEGELDFATLGRNGENGRIDWEKYEQSRQRWITIYLENLRERLGRPEYDLYVFEFEDHDHMGATLERGDTFRQAPHVVVRNH